MMFHQMYKAFIRGSHQIYLAICKVIRVAQQTDDWGVSLDRREAVAVVAVDQSKSFDSGGGDSAYERGEEMLVENFVLNP